MSKKEKPEKPKYNMWQNSGFMISLAWGKNRSVLWLCLIIASIEVIANLINLYITPTILGAIETSLPIGGLIRFILLFAAALVLVNAVKAYVNENKLFGRIEVRINIVAMIHEKVMTMSYPHTENQIVLKKLEKANKSVSDNNQATEAIWNTFTDLLKNTAGFLIYLALLALADPLLIIIVLATTTVGFFISRHLNSWGYRRRDEEAEYFRRLGYICTNAADYTLAKDIRVFGMKEWLEDVYNSVSGLYKSFITRGEKVYFGADAADVLLTFLRNGAAYFYLINMVLNNGLSASQFLLYFSAIGGFTSWMSGIFSNFSKLHQQSLDISTIREIIEYPEIFLFDDGEPLIPDTGKQYEIELRNVSFRYPGAEKETLKDINLIIKAGEKLAVVGLNGAGKTTLVKLICGFYDPTEGEVLLNGINIKKYNRRDYYKHFSGVFQSFSLLAATVAENIAQTEDGVDMEKVKLCAQKAGIDGKINSLPNKYDTHLGKEVYEDGTELSGGETQRLMLARALYKDAPVIVLDEPTAALDPIAESDVYNRYNELTSGRTAVYISHRLASTRFCDRIVLIENNMITEEGIHDALIAKGGKYAELYEIQSRYYKGGVLNEQ